MMREKTEIAHHEFSRDLVEYWRRRAPSVTRFFAIPIHSAIISRHCRCLTTGHPAVARDSEAASKLGRALKRWLNPGLPQEARALQGRTHMAVSVVGV
jgi:hypothetical protein